MAGKGRVESVGAQHRRKFRAALRIVEGDERERGVAPDNRFIICEQAQQGGMKLCARGVAAHHPSGRHAHVCVPARSKLHDLRIPTLNVRALFLALDELRERVLLVAHQVIILCARYILESLTEQELLAIDRQGDVANCAITSYALRDATRGLELIAYNVVAPLDAAGEVVTDAPDTTGHRA